MNERDKASERIERAALESLHQHGPDAVQKELGLFRREVGEALVVGATNDPSILLNRTLGLGVSSPATGADIRTIHEIYRERGVRGRYFLHVYPDSLAEGDAAFEGTPLVPARGWMKFFRNNETPPPCQTDLRVERVGRSGAADFGAIVAQCFGMTAAAGPLLAGLVRDPRWYLFVSYQGDTAAGAGALFIDEGFAWLEWGATRPEFRRRGSQGAILTARIEAAIAAGCDTMFTETGEASGGDPQHSYGNIRRHGFRESILRANWSPPAPA